MHDRFRRLDLAGIRRRRRRIVFVTGGNALGIATAAVDARRLVFGGDGFGGTDGGEALGCSLAEAALQLAEHDAIPAFHAGLLDALAVDEGAVGGFQINQLVNAIRLLQKLGVEAGDEGVVDDDVVFRVTTDGEAVFEHIEDEFVTIVEIEGQVRHAADAGKRRLKAGKLAGENQ